MAKGRAAKRTSRATERAGTAADMRTHRASETVQEVGDTVNTVLSRPPCALCRSPRPGRRVLWPLTHGIVIWLCDHHGSAEFRNRRGGRELAERLSELWARAGCLTRRRAAAIRAYVLQREGAPGMRDKPGSYSWPTLRREAEERFAAGHHPRAVITELRNRYVHNDALPPSARTMRRWFAEARWIEPQPPPPAGRRRERNPTVSRTAESILARILEGIDFLADTSTIYGTFVPSREPRFGIRQRR
jgi:hypothetical protein